MASWSLLPDAILISILSRLEILQDFFAVRGVCKSWRSAASPSPHSLASQSPLLLLDSPNYSKAFYDIAARRLYSLRILNRRHRRIINYSHGHLIIGPATGRDPAHSNIILLDIFTGKQTTLPNHIHDFAKLLLSARPDSADRIVVLVQYYIDRLVVQYLNARDDRWTVLSSPRSDLYDFIFFRGELYALTVGLDLIKVGLMGDSLRFWKFGDGGVVRSSRNNKSWLGGLDGVLMLVMRMWVVRDGEWRDEFDVYRWDLEKKGWDKVEELGDKALFVNRNANVVPFSVTGLGLRSSCVYTISQRPGQWDEFSLKDRSFETVKLDDTNLFISTSSYIWVFPNHC